MRKNWKIVPPKEREIYKAIKYRYIGRLTYTEFDVIDIAKIEGGIIDRECIANRMNIKVETCGKILAEMNLAGLLEKIHDVNDDQQVVEDGDCNKFALTDSALIEWHEALGEDPDEYRHEFGTYAAIRKAWKESNAYALLPAATGIARSLTLRPTTDRRYGEVWN